MTAPGCVDGAAHQIDCCCDIEIEAGPRVGPCPAKAYSRRSSGAEASVAYSMHGSSCSRCLQMWP